MFSLPCVHQQLLITSNGFLLQLSSRSFVSHQYNDLFLKIFLFQNLSPERKEPSKFSQIKASNSFSSIISLVLRVYHCHQYLNQLEVLFLIEMETVLLPKFLRMHRAPLKHLLIALSLELVYGGEHLIVLIYIFVELV